MKQALKNVEKLIDFGHHVIDYLPLVFDYQVLISNFLNVGTW